MQRRRKYVGCFVLLRVAVIVAAFIAVATQADAAGPACFLLAPAAAARRFLPSRNCTCRRCVSLACCHPCRLYLNAAAAAAGRCRLTSRLLRMRWIIAKSLAAFGFSRRHELDSDNALRSRGAVRRYHPERRAARQAAATMRALALSSHARPVSTLRGMRQESRNQPNVTKTNPKSRFVGCTFVRSLAARGPRVRRRTRLEASRRLQLMGGCQDHGDDSTDDIIVGRPAPAFYVACPSLSITSPVRRLADLYRKLPLSAPTLPLPQASPPPLSAHTPCICRSCLCTGRRGTFAGSCRRDTRPASPRTHVGCCCCGGGGGNALGCDLTSQWIGRAGSWPTHRASFRCTAAARSTSHRSAIRTR